jgi:cellulose biosynthesis protein BcsQ
MKVITISSRESGVGKSAVAVHLAHYLRGTGKSVAVIDLAYTDNTSRTLAKFAGSFTVPELFDGKARNPRRKHGVPRIELVRSDLREEMARWRRGEFCDPLESVFARFREGLACLAPTNDYCVVDTARGLCVRARSAIVAADLVLVPVVPMPGAAEQMDRFFIELAVLHVQSRTTPKATLLLPNRFRSVKREARAAQEQLCRCFRHPTIETPIVESEEIQAALSKRMPIWALDTRSSRRPAAQMRAAGCPDVVSAAAIRSAHAASQPTENRHSCAMHGAVTRNPQ